ncbi:hypothetical protein AX14_003131 [Amanita brunnescens Koide BX004]|nr:hypothetical protein AX14_003131 [Amanita brunnescens Koide BX004]
MNTIIIHPFNRVKSTPMHEMSATLIAPVSKWYRKPTPWWIDSFEEVRLQSIVETDEVAEEEEDVIDEQEDEEAVDEEDGAEGVTLGAFVDAELACNEFTLEDFQGNDEGKQNSLNETDIFQNITLEGTASIYTCRFDTHRRRDLDNDLPNIDRDLRDDEIEFLGVVMLVDSEASFDSDGECEGDDTLADVTFIGEGMFDP